MAKIPETIARNKNNPDRVRYLAYIYDLWLAFGDIPMDPETECLETPFTPCFPDSNNVRAVFPAGTHREDIWHWFEQTFHISIAQDLMY